MGKPKILTVVGARPQFIKAAVLSAALSPVAEEVLVHTGQHYDAALSGVFFERLPIPQPDVSLEVGSGSHGQQTGEMLKRLDPVIASERPDWVLVYGDTNSTLAGALAAAKLGVPVAHVEAGLRSYNRAMPEEINRVLTDHVAARLYCPAPFAAHQLAREGITAGVRVVGDVLDEALGLVAQRPAAWLTALGVSPSQYCLATIHRQANADDRGRLAAIAAALGELALPVLWPLHPRTAARLKDWGIPLPSGVRTLEPVGYSESLTLIRHARVVVTDSGGVQREAGLLGVPCCIVRAETEWLDLLEAGRAVLVPNPLDLPAAVAAARPRAEPRRAAEGVAAAIARDLAAGSTQSHWDCHRPM